MAKTSVSVELFFAGGCGKCAEARGSLRQAVESIPGARWNEVDIGTHPDRAVEAGVLSTPAVAIDGELLFKTMPCASELRTAIRARAGES